MNGEINLEQPEQAGVAARDDAQFQQAVTSEIERRESVKREQEEEERKERLEEARKAADRWPEKGYDGPPPWEIARAYEQPEHRLERDPNTGTPKHPPLAYAGPGAVSHSRPILSYGSIGGDVAALVGLLKEAGYADNTVARGESVVLDNTVMSDVKRFCRDYGVTNDIAEFEGKERPAADLVDEHVGPYIWQALVAVAQARHDELASREPDPLRA